MVPRLSSGLRRCIAIATYTSAPPTNVSRSSPSATRTPPGSVTTAPTGWRLDDGFRERTTDPGPGPGRRTECASARRAPERDPARGDRGIQRHGQAGPGVVLRGGVGGAAAPGVAGRSVHSGAVPG